MTQTALPAQILAFSMELSNEKWVLTLGNFAHGTRRDEIDAGDFEALRVAIESARTRFKLPAQTKLVSCYEAGRDGFWIHRRLLELGVENLVVDSASIEVSRRRRRKKNDRIDGRKLLEMLLRYLNGESKIWSVVRVPSVEEEDQRRRTRELERLKHERTQHLSRIRGLLMLEGIRLGRINAQLPEFLKSARRHDGSALGEHLHAELLREHERLQLVERQLKALEETLKLEVADETNSSPAVRQVRRLLMLKGMGKSAWVLSQEFFAWRTFRNRREVGGLAGLDGTPYDSGDSRREQGISKAGNRRVRWLMVELAWIWVRYQPGSELVRWFKTKFGEGTKRSRRVGIVALARKLLVAVWRYLEHGEVPAGAVLKAAQAEV